MLKVCVLGGCKHLGYELTCTSHKQHTKNFDELEILEAKLKSDEPFEKSGIQNASFR